MHKDHQIRLVIVLQEAEQEEESDAMGESPRMIQRLHSRARQASSGNTMLDQLLSDISNKFVKYVDEVMDRLFIAVM